MKPFLVALLCCIYWNPASGAEGEATERQPQVHKLTAAAFSDTFEKPDWFFLLDGTVAYRSFEALKEGIGKIVSAGSTLQWESSDVGVTPEAFSSPEKLKGFEEFCKARGVRFVVLPGG
jgi:hypothetical protein